MKIRMGIDVGGTKANMGLLTGEGEIIARHKLMMPKGAQPDEQMKLIAEAAKKLVGDSGYTMDDLLFVGMGVPGTVDETNTIVLNCPNLGWINVHAAEQFYALCGIRPLVAQDSRASALGEYLCGSGKNAKVLVSVTLGTGIGGGIILNGKIYNGALGTAGEIGHIPVVTNGRLCGCGRHGCAEAYGSGTGIARSADEHPAFKGLHLPSERIFELAEAGNADALEVISDCVEKLGCGLCAVINVLSPDAMIFSGGLCAQRKLYVDPLIKFIRTHAYSLGCNERLKIDVSILGADAPMIGAAMLDKALH